MRRLLASLLLACALSTAAGARSDKTLAYTRETVWPTAVRFLVVDEKVKVTDKDGDAGYVLFELKDEGKTYRGSLEVMTVVKDKRTSVKFVLQIADRPEWMEVAMLNRLERKLRSELGSPSPSPVTPAPSEPKPPEPPAETK
ncbi:MAG: hypothetical protein JNL83_00210 [Myxococcales bacterium]|nr:hypothetical protein [Myxococcales bacterium]